MQGLGGSGDSSHIIKGDEMAKIAKSAEGFEKAGKIKKLSKVDTKLLGKIRDANLNHEKRVVVDSKAFEALKGKLKKTWGEKLASLVSSVGRAMFRSKAPVVQDRVEIAQNNFKNLTEDSVKKLTSKELSDVYWVASTTYGSDTTKQMKVINGEVARREEASGARGKELESQKFIQFQKKAAKCVNRCRVDGLKSLLKRGSFKKLSLENRLVFLEELEKQSFGPVKHMLQTKISELKAELNLRDFKINDEQLLREFKDVSASLKGAAKEVGKFEEAAAKAEEEGLYKPGIKPLQEKRAALLNRLNAVAGEIEKRGSSVRLEADMAVDVSKLDFTELGEVEDRLTKAAVDSRKTGGEKGPLQGDAAEKLAEVRLAKLSIPGAELSNAEFAQKQSLFGTDKELTKLSGEVAQLGGEKGIEGFKVTIASQEVENLQRMAGALKGGREEALSAGRDVDESPVQQEVEINVMLQMKRAVAARPEKALAIDLEKAGLEELVSAEKTLVSAQKELYTSAKTELAAGRPVEDSQIELLAKIMEKLPQVTSAKEWAEAKAEVAAQPKREVKEQPVKQGPIDLEGAAKQFQKPVRAKAAPRDWKAAGKERAAAREERLEALVSSEDPQVLKELVDNKKESPGKIARALKRRSQESAAAYATELLDARVALARRSLRELPTELPKAPAKETASSKQPARDVKAGRQPTTAQIKRSYRRAARRARRAGQTKTPDESFVAGLREKAVGLNPKGLKTDLRKPTFTQKSVKERLAILRDLRDRIDEGIRSLPEGGAGVFHPVRKVVTDEITKLQL